MRLLEGDADELLRIAIDEGAKHLPVMFFLHGWPDNAEVWRHQISHFQGRYRTVAVELPNYSSKAENRKESLWGVDFDVLADRCVNTIRAVSQGQPVVLVTHDWGAWIGYMVEKAHPEIIGKMVALDVGGSPTEGATVRTACFGLFYQLWNVLAFLCCRPVGNAMVRSLVRSFFPTCPTPQHEITSAMSYPYYYTWKKGPPRAAWCVEGYQGRELPSCQTLFLHSTVGPRVYGLTWVHDLKDRKGSRVEAMPCRHWIMTEEPKQMNSIMDEFLGAR